MESPLMEIMGRKDDVILVITQDNDARTVEVREVKGEIKTVEAMFGYTPDGLISKGFKTLLPERIQENIDDYVEFEQFGADIGDVLKRTPNFCVRHQGGDVIDVDLRVQQGLMGEHPRYILIMTDRSKGGGACVAALEANAVELQMDGSTGLLTEQGLLSQAEIVMRFIAQDEMKAVLALVEWHGEKEVVGEQMQRSFRKTDQLASLGNGVYAALLLKTDNTGAEIALSRLQKKANQQVKMVFHTMGPEANAQTILQKCRHQLSVCSPGQAPAEVI